MTKKLSKILVDAGDSTLMFWCPGCDGGHGIPHGAGSGPRWTWNGDADKPTLSPSILVSYDHWVPSAGPGLPPPGKQTLVKDVCHSYVVDGRIQFLGDCTHELAGQTVDIPEWDKA